MGKSRKIIIGTVAGVTAGAVAAGIGGVLLWRHFRTDGDSDGLAYVCQVSEINTAAASISDMRFSGVVEPQETKEIKADLSKTISDVAVQEGAHVEAGDPLFTYDVESMELELAQGNVEIERMENEITASKQQITQLENEKKSASADDKLTYTTQIQSLETDIAKTEYDIKTKKIELEKLQNTINNATVTAEIAGTVQSLKTVEQLQMDGTDVLMKITSDGEFRVKCTASEQNMYMLYMDEPVTVQSRIDDTSWNGTISEIGSEPETNQNDMYYYGGSDDMSTASKYPFYVTLESSEGLMLGQHLLVSPSMGDTVEKDGIWLYSDYILTDEDGTSYVWAADSRDRLEKREVELGQSDEMMGDCEVVSGLSEDDCIAYPSDDLEAGMRTTTNIDDIPMEDDGVFVDEGVVYDEDGEVIDDGIVYDENGEVIDDGMMYEEYGEIADDEMMYDENGELIDEAYGEIADGDTEEGGAADGT
ncbi:efflux RND transporter periplasmic adaptor subunit [uncultured Ruminococcus sp.]|uniref:efflux RND transporter periplasmic adaptor subunit n=1 Tax=uncultured Ruminococcus sp. TaxID=165186 RepID=UPI0026046169|nr:efflux RND transporter periplasmic adaptor subunit [uncultured Ruminococcus sp.]